MHLVKEERVQGEGKDPHRIVPCCRSRVRQCSTVPHAAHSHHHEFWDPRAGDGMSRRAQETACTMWRHEGLLLQAAERRRTMSAALCASCGATGVMYRRETDLPATTEKLASQAVEARVVESIYCPTCGWEERRGVPLRSGLVGGASRRPSRE